SAVPCVSTSDFLTDWCRHERQSSSVAITAKPGLHALRSAGSASTLMSLASFRFIDLALCFGALNDASLAFHFLSFVVVRNRPDDGEQDADHRRKADEQARPVECRDHVRLPKRRTTLSPRGS